MNTNPKFNLFEFVEIDGTGTGLGELVGWIKSIEYCNISKQFIYEISVYGQKVNSINISEKWLSISPRSSRLNRIISKRYVLEKRKAAN